MTLDRARVSEAGSRTRIPWARVLLLVDGSFFLIVGAFVSIIANQGHTDGKGPFGRALEGQPYVVGFVEAGLLIAVIGAGLVVSGLRTPSRLWHGWAILAHGTLAAVDLTYMGAMASMHLPATNLVALVLIHTVCIAAHVAALAGSRRTSLVRPA